MLLFVLLSCPVFVVYRDIYREGGGGGGTGCLYCGLAAGGIKILVTGSHYTTCTIFCQLLILCTSLYLEILGDFLTFRFACVYGYSLQMAKVMGVNQPHASLCMLHKLTTIKIQKLV